MCMTVLCPQGSLGSMTLVSAKYMSYPATQAVPSPGRAMRATRYVSHARGNAALDRATIAQL